MAERDYPVGKAQAMVLAALGITASGFSDAERIFGEIGISVSAKRVGRVSEPEIRVLDRYHGGFNVYGEGETWRAHEDIDLSALMPWIVNKDDAAAITAAARRAADAKAQAQPATTDDGADHATQLSDNAPYNQSGPLSWSGYAPGCEMVSWRGDDGWYSTLRGVSPDGNAFECDDWGPFPTRAAAEDQARENYAMDQEPELDPMAALYE